MARGKKFIVDQSQKVEEIGRDSAIAFTNIASSDYETKGVLIPSEQKEEVWGSMNSLDKSKKHFKYKVFSFGVFTLIQDDIPNLDILTIDKEYEGQEHRIKNMLTNFIENYTDLPSSTHPRIEFDYVHNIGDHDPPKCHNRAQMIAKKEIKPYLVTNLDFMMTVTLPRK